MTKHVNEVELKNIKYVIIKEGIVLFNDALSTFYLRLYGVRTTQRESKPAAATWVTLSD